MFKRFVRLYCKNLKTLCMFLIMLRSSKSGVASSWCCQFWDVCGNTFFTGWRSVGRPESQFFSLFTLEIHFWGVPEAKNAVLKEEGASHFEFSVTSLMEADWPSACKKRISTYVPNLAVPATGNSTFTRLKHNEKHT